MEESVPTTEEAVPAFAPIGSIASAVKLPKSIPKQKNTIKMYPIKTEKSILPADDFIAKIKQILIVNIIKEALLHKNFIPYFFTINEFNIDETPIESAEMAK